MRWECCLLYVIKKKVSHYLFTCLQDVFKGTGQMYYSYLRELETKLNKEGDLVVIRRDDMWIEYLKAKFSFCFRQKKKPIVESSPNTVTSTVTGKK